MLPVTGGISVKDMRLAVECPGKSVTLVTHKGAHTFTVTERERDGVTRLSCADKSFCRTKAVIAFRFAPIPKSDFLGHVLIDR